MAHKPSAFETFENLEDGFFAFDRSWRFTYVNRRGAELTGKPPGELIGQVLWEILPALAGTPADAMLRRTMELRTVQHVETHGILSSGWFHITSFPTDEGVSAYMQDITDCKRIKGTQLLKIAIHDELTGVHNRFFFDATIRRFMEMSDRYDAPLSMALLRPDGFQALRHSRGRSAADEVIRQIARTIEEIIRSADLLVRFGDEEFGILLPHTDHFGAAEAAEKIREAIEKSDALALAGVTVSLGVAERLKAESYRHWYRRMDEALYNAGKAGTNRVAIWDRYDRLPVGSVKLAWQREWESGNPVIDKQHRELVDLANRLVEASNRRRPMSELAPQIDKLQAEISAHFEYEDRVLAVIGHPDHDRRSDMHRRQLGKVAWVRRACTAEEVTPEALVSCLLDDVILEHLMDTDEVFHYERNEI